MYAICNIDDVTWGNRPTNASKGLNVAVSDEKRQEIMRQSYRKTRATIVMWWCAFMTVGIFFVDSLILSAYHNNNVAVKDGCQAIIKVYTIFLAVFNLTVLFFAGVHHFFGNTKLMLFSKYRATPIVPRKAITDPEA